MKVLLLNNVKNLGHAGKIVEVKPGYAVNFLLPKKLATTDFTVRVDSKKGKQISEEDAKTLIKKVVGSRLKLTKKASSKGTFFSAVSEDEISQVIEQKVPELRNTGYSVKILGPIKIAGSHKVTFSLKGIKVPLKITVTAEEKKKVKKSTNKKVAEKKITSAKSNSFKKNPKKISRKASKKR